MYRHESESKSAGQVESPASLASANFAYAQTGSGPGPIRHRKRDIDFISRNNVIENIVHVPITVPITVPIPIHVDIEGKKDSSGIHVVDEGPDRGEKEAVDGEEKRGLLQCDGKYIDSEVIYWKIVPGDNTYESPITPHHDLHHDRYLTYEYDEGGWNNIRMSLECVLVFTHAMGRTLVSPPRQNLYLLDKKHKAKDGKVRSGMGFEDFFDLDLLKSHKGYHVMTAEQFLAKEGVTGGLHGILPPKNSTKIGGRT
jgi:hypothetical protein